jgi:hypothetical protein
MYPLLYDVSNCAGKCDYGLLLCRMAKIGGAALATFVALHMPVLVDCGAAAGFP